VPGKKRSGRRVQTRTPPGVRKGKGLLTVEVIDFRPGMSTRKGREVGAKTMAGTQAVDVTRRGPCRGGERI